MSIRIYTMTHKQFELPPDSMYTPLHVGRAGNSNAAGMSAYTGDDTGEHISNLNCYYSELTGFYWIWKNCHDIDYVGTCHYRRYLINEQEQIFTEKEYKELLKSYDLITTKRVQLNNSYYYGFSANHNIKALDMTGIVIKEKYPEYYDTFERLVHGTETYFGNILVTSKTLFDAYAKWLFGIFFEVQKRIELETGEDAYHKRVFGFISEFLLLVWVTAQNLRICECKVGMLGEKAETRELKEQLAVFFAQKDIDGAKNFFLKTRELRPDVLMEASDVTGELRLSMQVIATAGEEQQHYGSSILDRINDFRGLMDLFGRLNQIVSHYRNRRETPDDIAFLRRSGISEIAVRIAVMILRENQEIQTNIQNRIINDMNCVKNER